MELLDGKADAAEQLLLQKVQAFEAEMRRRAATVDGSLVYASVWMNEQGAETLAERYQISVADVEQVKLKLIREGRTNMLLGFFTRMKIEESEDPNGCIIHGSFIPYDRLARQYILPLEIVTKLANDMFDQQMSEKQD